MKNSMFVCFLLCSVCVPLSGFAIVTASNTVAETSPEATNGFNWDYVYNYKKSSAVAVGSHWLLTAAHVADDSSSAAGFSNVVVSGTTYYPQEIIFHSAADDAEHDQTADLALVRFDKKFPGFYTLYSGEFPEEGWAGPPWNQYWVDGLDAVMVGYGTTGTVSSLYYTPKAWNANPNGSGTKRWGTQTIEGNYSMAYDGLGDVGMTTNVGIEMSFDSTGSDYEAGLGTYDSGGGTFVEEDGVWKLAGVNTITGSHVTSVTGAKDWMFAVSVPAYETWITETMDSVTGDDDSDGIPNWWEERAGANVTATADQDGDGMTGEEEYIADTDPMDGDDFFEIKSFNMADTQQVIFEGSTARQYQLFSSTNQFESWDSVGSSVWGDGTTTLSSTNSSSNAFFRLWVTLP